MPDTQTSYDPDLLPDTKYYWKVDLVYDGNVVMPDEDVWSFETAKFPGHIHADINYISSGTMMFNQDDIISLERAVPGFGSNFLVDSTTVPGFLVDKTYGVKTYKRDLSRQARLKKLWSDSSDMTNPTLGYRNLFMTQTLLSGTYPPIQDGYRRSMSNIGEIGQILKKSVYDEPAKFDPTKRVRNTDRELDVRIDLADPNVQEIFKYITRIDPNNTYSRIKGRININTAPWSVLAQLPWVSKRKGTDNQSDNQLAKAIVNYRDETGAYAGGRYGVISGKTITESYTPSNSFLGITYSYIYPVINTLWQGDIDARGKGFSSIGELTHVIAGTAVDSINYYALDGKDQVGFPDLSYNRFSKTDGSPDDFEERNLIFSRISDLVTVRSDVFTAYVLVRPGEDGPQRRIITILDRSEVKTANDKVKVLVKYPVPDSR